MNNISHAILRTLAEHYSALAFSTPCKFYPESNQGKKERPCVVFIAEEEEFLHPRLFSVVINAELETSMDDTDPANAAEVVREISDYECQAMQSIAAAGTGRWNLRKMQTNNTSSQPEGDRSRIWVTGWKLWIREF